MNVFKSKSQLNSYNIINYLLKIFPYNFFKKIIYKTIDNTLIFFINKINLKFYINFLKNHYSLQFKTLTTITATDYPQQKERFEISYFLLSYFLNTRICIKIYTNDITPIESINKVYPCSV